jgi:hypothetical protein
VLAAIAPSPAPVDAVASADTAAHRLIDAELALMFTFSKFIFLKAEVPPPSMKVQTNKLS